ESVGLILTVTSESVKDKNAKASRTKVLAASFSCRETASSRSKTKVSAPKISELVSMPGLFPGINSKLLLAICSFHRRFHSGTDGIIQCTFIFQKNLSLGDTKLFQSLFHYLLDLFSKGIHHRALQMKHKLFGWRHSHKAVIGLNGSAYC